MVPKNEKRALAIRLFGRDRVMEAEKVFEEKENARKAARAERVKNGSKNDVDNDNDEDSPQMDDTEDL